MPQSTGGDPQEAVRAAHHQIGNSLQSVASLLRLKGRDAAPEAAGILLEASRRVRVIMRLHQRLQEGVASEVRLDDLLGDVCRDVADLGVLNHEVEVRADLAPLTATPKLASALAMITAELVGNALEHGLADRDGAVRVTLKPQRDGGRLRIADTGAGSPSGAFAEGFGLSLVSSLTHQIGGTLRRRTGRAGTMFVIHVAELRPGSRG